MGHGQHHHHERERSEEDAEEGEGKVDSLRSQAPTKTGNEPPALETFQHYQPPKTWTFVRHTVQMMSKIRLSAVGGGHELKRVIRKNRFLDPSTASGALRCPAGFENYVNGQCARRGSPGH